MLQCKPFSDNALIHHVRNWVGLFETVLNLLLCSGDHVSEMPDISHGVTQGLCLSLCISHYTIFGGQYL